MSAWAETRWLYWLDHLNEPPIDGARVWLVHPDELDQLAPRMNPVVAWIGRRSDGDVPSGLAEARIDTTPWTQHSDAPTIARAARGLSEYARVVLFHNFPTRLDKFIAEYQLRRCVPLTVESTRI